MLAAIVVTHNSVKVLPRCLQTLEAQTRQPDRIVVVDSGSDNTSYLESYRGLPGVTMLMEKNIGYAAANNLGAAAVMDSCDLLLFLNPDTFLARDCIEQALQEMAKHSQAGAVSGKLLWYDVDGGRETDRLDSTGIFRAWYGRWHDRGQHDIDRGLFDQAASVPAVCGALMLCRTDAILDVLLPDGSVFDPEFFMYKEDIELCLRLRKAGWEIVYQPRCKAWHGRGWKRERTGIPREIRMMAAANEVLLYRKHPSPYMAWALLKYALVRVFNI